jgi:hypothetical protein
MFLDHTKIVQELELELESELKLLNELLNDAQIRDFEKDSLVVKEYLRLIKCILTLTNVDINLFDVIITLTFLQRAKIWFSERTSSLDYYLIFNKRIGDTTVIPNRFVVQHSDLEEVDYPNYETRRFVREILLN